MDLTFYQWIDVVITGLIYGLVAYFIVTNIVKFVIFYRVASKEYDKQKFIDRHKIIIVDILFDEQGNALYLLYDKILGNFLGQGSEVAEVTKQMVAKFPGKQVIFQQRDKNGTTSTS